MSSFHRCLNTLGIVLAIVLVINLVFGMCASAGPDEAVSEHFPSLSGNESVTNSTVRAIVINVTPAVPKISTGRSSGASLAAGTHPVKGLAKAPVNPKFLQYQNRTKKSAPPKTSTPLRTDSTGKTTSHIVVEGEVPSPVDLTHNTGQHIGRDSGSGPGSGSGSGSTTRLDSGNYAGLYDLRTVGKVSLVKDQGAAGVCWAFGTYGSIESFFLPNESWVFSEDNMKNTLSSTYIDGFDRGPNDAGNEWEATAYLTRWSGPVRASDDPYSDTSVSSPGGLTVVKHVQNVYFLPSRANSTDNDNIKYALTHYGAVKASIYYSDSDYNARTYAFYNGATTDTNHAITIVGWDDSYSRANFTSQPRGNGAFIAKNSWGTSWGNNGYFYISYYDRTVGDYCVAYTGEPVTDYDRVYSYDPLGKDGELGYGSSTSAEYANIFTSQSAEILKAVGFYTPVSNTAYVVTVYRSPDNGPINTGGPAATTSGTLSSPGYHTVTVPDVVLTAGQKFSIVVSATTPGYDTPVPIEYPLADYASHATALAGESYVSSDGSIWTDLTTSNPNTNVCLKGYTKLSPYPVYSSINPPGTWYRNATINYTITGTNFLPNGTTVTFRNKSGLYLNGTDAGVTNVTPTTINGHIHVPYNAPTGAWNISIIIAGGGTTWKDSALTVQAVPKPVYTSIASPGTWYRNATINYTITGANFQLNNTAVAFRNTNGVYLNGTDAGVTFVTQTSINGTIHIPYNAQTGAWNISISTVDGGTIWKDSALSVQQFPKPAFTSITPAGIWYRNATVNYSITGTNFQPGNTGIMFWNRSGVILNVSSGAGILSVTTTRINGTILIPKNASVVTPYNITITTVDGGSGGRDAAMTVLPYPPPAIQSFTPAAGFKNTTVSFTLAGNNFPEAGGYTNITLVNEYTGEKLYGALASATSTRITGTLAFPAGSLGGTYDLLVATVDGGTAVKEGAFTLNNLPLPTISAINQTSGYRNTTVPFMITGNNFQPGGGTFVRINSTAGAPVLAVLSSVTSTSVTGAFVIPFNTGTGLYRLDVLTLSGGSASRLNAFTVNPVPAPGISSVSPTQSYRNRTFVITVTGTNFQPDGLTLMTADLISPSNVYYNVSLINATTTRFNGLVTVYANATTATPWKLNITTKEGGRTSRPSAITIQSYPAPTFASITPNSGRNNTIAAFTVKGTNFQPGGTNVTFWNRTGNTVLVPSIISVNSTYVVGTVTIPPHANQSWYVNLSTVDGGLVGKEKAFTVY